MHLIVSFFLSGLLTSIIWGGLTARRMAGAQVGASFSVNRMTVGVMALVAEQEREAISTRTKAALAAARARGVKLGNPRPETAAFHHGAAASIAGAKSGETRAAMANDFARLILPLLDDELAGLSANAAAAELNRRGVQTARGNGKWTARAILNLKARRAPA
jgi:DNA invertase Pin-like site-specific DNA recombinase